jgi:hypothetical protein
MGAIRLQKNIVVLSVLQKKDDRSFRRKNYAAYLADALVNRTCLYL